MKKYIKSLFLLVIASVCCGVQARKTYTIKDNTGLKREILFVLQEAKSAKKQFAILAKRLEKAETPIPLDATTDYVFRFIRVDKDAFQDTMQSSDLLTLENLVINPGKKQAITVKTEQFQGDKPSLGLDTIEVDNNSNEHIALVLTGSLDYTYSDTTVWSLLQPKSQNISIFKPYTVSKSKVLPAIRTYLVQNKKDKPQEINAVNKLVLGKEKRTVIEVSLDPNGNLQAQLVEEK